MVVHQPGDWFVETLRGLAEQDYPGLQYLFLLTGEAGDPAGQPARDAIETHVPGAVVRHTGGNAGFGSGCNSVLSLVEGDTGIFCFLHDDVALAPGAVTAMVEEMQRSNAGVVGPKLVHWDDQRMIQSVGVAVDRLGVEMPLADDGEIDQEQHDVVQDVFVLSSACLMVRADLFRALDGFDASLATVGADLDFCWRVHLTGARVVVVPAAVARHRESMLERSDEDETVLEAERNRVRLATVASLTASTQLVPTMMEAVVVTLVHAVSVLVTGSPRRAFDEVRALLALPFSVGRIRRRRAGVTRTLTGNEVRALQVRGSAYVVGYLRRRDRRRGIEQAQAGQEGQKEAAPRASIVLWSVLITALVIGSRSLLLHGPADVGQFVHITSGPRDLLSAFASGWWNAGFGQVASAPTGLLVSAIGGVVTFGHPGLLRTLAIVGAPLAGWLGVWRFSSVLTTRAARVAATLAYAATPLAWTSIAAGRMGGLATYALFPWVVHALRRLVGHVPLRRASNDETDEFGDLSEPEWRRTFALASLLCAVLFAFEPGAAVALGLLGVVWCVATLLHGARLQWSARWLGIPALTGTAAVLLNLPWSASFLSHGWWRAVAGAPVEGGRDLGLRRIMRFEFGDFVMARPAILLGVPVIGAILVVRGSRLPWALRGATLSITGTLLVFLDDKALLPVHLPEPAVMMVPAAFGLAVCAGAMGAGLAVDLRGGRISWRQPLGVLVAAAFTVGLVPTAVNVWAGDWNQPGTTLGRLLTQLPAQSESGDYRTLFLGDPRVLPGAPVSAGWGIAYSVVSGSAATLEDMWEPTSTRATDNAERAVNGIIRGTTTRAGRLLAPLAVRFIVVPVVDGGLSTRSNPIEAPSGLVDAVGRQLDLKRRYASPDLAIFENTAWVPVASVLTPAGATASRSAGPESMIANDLTGATPVLPGILSGRSARAEVPAGVLHLSVPYSTKWEVSDAAGASQVATPAFGLTDAFDRTSSAAGVVSLRFRSSLLHQALVLLMIVVWSLVAWVSVPRARRRRAVSALTPPEGGTAIVMGDGS